MRNLNAAKIALAISEKLRGGSDSTPLIVIECEENVLTLEDIVGGRFLITVESMYDAPDSKPLPNPGE